MKKRNKLALTGALLAASSMASAVTIDIGMMYTDQAKQSTGNIQTKINQLIAHANQVYSQNGVNITLRQVGSLDLTTNNVTPTSGWLNAVTDSSWIKDTRNQWGADMMAVIGVAENQGNGYITCGIAWVGQGSNGNLYSSQESKMFSISGADCGNNTFVHELGHNMGLTHSRKQGDTSGGVYVDGMGHGKDGVFSSIMGYPHVFGGATQYDYFSNPNWSVSGYPYGITGQAYGWRTVNDTKYSISNFR